jgi:hypothetical protein
MLHTHTHAPCIFNDPRNTTTTTVTNNPRFASSSAAGGDAHDGRGGGRGQGPRQRGPVGQAAVPAHDGGLVVDQAHPVAARARQRKMRHPVVGADGPGPQPPVRPALRRAHGVGQVPRVGAQRRAQRRRGGAGLPCVAYAGAGRARGGRRRRRRGAGGRPRGVPSRQQAGTHPNTAPSPSPYCPPRSPPTDD